MRHAADDKIAGLFDALVVIGKGQPGAQMVARFAHGVVERFGVLDAIRANKNTFAAQFLEKGHKRAILAHEQFLLAAWPPILKWHGQAALSITE